MISEKVHFMVPTVGAGFVGFALMLIFLPTMNYVMTVICLLLRLLWPPIHFEISYGSCVPLFSHQMFVNLTNKYAGTILAGLGCCFCLCQLRSVCMVKDS